MYVEDIDKAIRTLRADHDNLSKKLAAARVGTPYDDPELKKPGETLIDITLEEEELDVVIDAVQLRQGHIEQYPDLVFRMAFVYLIATFDAFLTDIFGLVILSKPAILKSKKQISYEKLLDFSSRDELVEYLAKRELHELSYRSIKEQVDYYNERFGLSFAGSNISVEELVELQCTRNVLVHNNGVITHLYVEQVAGSKYKVGEQVVVDAEYFESANKRLRKVVMYLSTELTSKFAA